MNSRRSPKMRVAVAGLGAIGTKVVKALDQGIEGLALAAVSVRNVEKHRAWLSELTTVPAVLPIEALADAADIVVECDRSWRRWSDAENVPLCSASARCSRTTI